MKALILSFLLVSKYQMLERFRTLYFAHTFILSRGSHKNTHYFPYSINKLRFLMDTVDVLVQNGLKFYNLYMFVYASPYTFSLIRDFFNRDRHI